MKRKTGRGSGWPGLDAGAHYTSPDQRPAEGAVRRSWLPAAAASVVLAVGGLPGRAQDGVPVVRLGTRLAGDDWPQMLGPRRDGTSRERGIRTRWRTEGLPLLWQYPLVESYAPGVTAYGRFFQFDRVAGEGKLVCLEAETGVPIWEFTYPYDYSDLYGYNRGPRCSPVVDGDRVYIYGVDGMLHCLRVTDGQLMWKVDTVSQFGVVQNFFGVASSPVVYQDLLLVMVGGSPPEAQKIAPGRLDQVTSNGSGIVAFDKRTGQVRYRTADDLASYASLQVVERGGRAWCFAFMRSALVAFDPATGKIDFRYPWRAELLESVNASTPVVHGDRVFISEAYGPGSSLLAFRPGEYQLIWRDDPRERQKAMQTHWNTPVYKDGFLYGCSGRYSATSDLRCIDWGTGRVVWRQPGLGLCSVTLVDGHLICLSEDGMLRLIRVSPQRFELVGELRPTDASTGEPLLDYPAWAPPFVSHGLLYVRGGRRVICLELMASADSSAGAPASR